MIIQTLEHDLKFKSNRVDNVIPAIVSGLMAIAGKHPGVNDRVEEAFDYIEKIQNELNFNKFL